MIALVVMVRGYRMVVRSVSPLIVVVMRQQAMA